MGEDCRRRLINVLTLCDAAHGHAALVREPCMPVALLKTSDDMRLHNAAGSIDALQLGIGGA